MGWTRTPNPLVRTHVPTDSGKTTRPVAACGAPDGGLAAAPIVGRHEASAAGLKRTDIPSPRSAGPKRKPTIAAEMALRTNVSLSRAAGQAVKDEAHNTSGTTACRR